MTNGQWPMTNGTRPMDISPRAVFGYRSNGSQQPPYRKKLRAGGVCTHSYRPTRVVPLRGQSTDHPSCTTTKTMYRRAREREELIAEFEFRAATHVIDGRYEEDSDGDMFQEASMLAFAVRTVLESVREDKREDHPGGRVLPRNGPDALRGRFSC